MKKKNENIVAKEKVFFLGKLIFDRKQMNTFFRDQNGVLHDLLKISFSSKEFNSEDGDLILPKPEIIDGNGAIEESGDMLLYSYINGNPDDIVIISSIYNIKLSHVDKQLRMGTDDIDAIRKRIGVRNNKKRYLVINDDGAGNYYFYLKGKDKNGNVAVKITGDGEGNGNFKFELNGKCLLKQVDDKGELISKIFMDNTKDAEKTIFEDKHQNVITMSKDGVTITDQNKNLVELNKKGMIVKGECIDVKGRDSTGTLTLKKILTDLVQAILAMTQPTNTGATVGPPVNMADFLKVKQDAEKLLKENS
ncbi:MAG: hypothetical protein M0P61_00460 [Ignavibacteriaceae bacterium]|jgi:hypothetical protein|nr:hypothetical protein [Ignavibacteriaceae bacterium]